jgi:hypothetical protein
MKVGIKNAVAGAIARYAEQKASRDEYHEQWMNYHKRKWAEKVEQQRIYDEARIHLKKVYQEWMAVIKQYCKIAIATPAILARVVLLVVLYCILTKYII